MCDYEDIPVISKYTLKEGIEDGLFYEVYYWKGKPVVSTIGINNDFKLEQIITIFNRFKVWKEKVEPALPEEERLFSTDTNNGKVWILEDGEAYTVLYPHEY